jgi:hypothetical protein
LTRMLVGHRSGSAIATQRRIPAPASMPCFRAGRRRPRAAPSESARTQACAREGLWDGGPRARRRTGRTRFSGRVGVQAVHGGCGAPACARRQAVARRFDPRTSRAARLRHADHDPADASAHERPARLATWRTSRAGRAARASTPMRTSSTSWAARNT